MKHWDICNVSNLTYRYFSISNSYRQVSAICNVIQWFLGHILNVIHTNSTLFVRNDGQAAALNIVYIVKVFKNDRWLAVAQQLLMIPETYFRNLLADLLQIGKSVLTNCSYFCYSRNLIFTKYLNSSNLQKFLGMQMLTYLLKKSLDFHINSF